MTGPDPLTLLLAYGPAPGVELIPYFLGLLAWAGLAVGAVLFSPVAALWRRFRKGRSAPEPEAASAPESPGEGSSDRA